MQLDKALVLSLIGFAAHAVADPTWPADIDELEEIMYQTSRVRSRKFADTVFPCTREVSGAGRKNAAEWLRTAFHDMSTGNAFTGAGGLDASLQYELGSSENTGPAFANTMTFMAPYMTRKSSMSDLIALGVYISVLSCGGPSINFQSGRIDATERNNPGVPQPGEVIQVFRSKFTRMGFSNQEMIQATACGHTIGAVHSAENSDIVPAGQFENDAAAFDSTDAVFDPNVVTEYLAGSTKNPLVVVPGTSKLKNSDFRVFNSDRNETVSAMKDPAAFNSVCKSVFEKMINLVPSGVTLSNAIKPYQVKPVQLQLSLQTVSTMQLTGYIRVRTTNLPLGNIAGLTIDYKNRNGGTACGSANCVFTIPLQGISKGLEDTFAWFPIGQTIPVTSGISSFTVTINMQDGSSTLYNNNGSGYPIQDGIFLQTDQSCLNQNSGDATFVAAVRNDRTSLPVSVNIWYKTKRTTSVVPLLSNMTLSMTKGDCKGGYTFYSVTTNIPGDLSVESTLDFISGDMVDSFKKANIVGGGCRSWAGGSTCSTLTVSSVVPSSASSTAAPTATLRHRDFVGGYKLVSCWTEASNGRALKGASFAYDRMTLESCMGNCTGFDYWGTEYGRECYCGNSLDTSTTSAPLSDCNFICSGDSTQYCGAGNRIELYSTTATRTSTSTPAPTATLAHVPVIGLYSLVGCQTEATNNVRALQAASVASDDMTLEKCAAFCSSYTYFGTEYGRECYCGNTLQQTSKPAPITECTMKCAGDPFQYCGDGNRLELYKLESASSVLLPSTVSATTTASTFSNTVKITATSSAPINKPTIAAYNLTGCWTEGNGVRALSQKSYSSHNNMTLKYCAAFCSDYKYFGTEYSAECYCGNFLASSSASAPLSDCSMTCSGNQYEYCGGGNRLTLYSNNLDVVEPTSPATVGAYTFLGCHTEPTQGGRALPLESTASDQMSNDVCAEFCDGYTYFGTEYSGECYCGNILPDTSLVAPASDCNMVCSGNSTQLCGGGNRLSVYRI